MPHSQAYTAGQHRKSQPSTLQGNVSEAGKEQGSSQGMQTLAAGLSRISVSGSSDNDVSAQTRQHQSRRSRQGMVNHGDGQECRTGKTVDARVPLGRENGRPSCYRDGAKPDQGDRRPGRDSPFQNPNQKFHGARLDNASGRRPLSHYDLPPPLSPTFSRQDAPPHTSQTRSKQSNRGGHVSPNRHPKPYSGSSRTHLSPGVSAGYPASFESTHQQMNRSASGSMNSFQEPRRDLPQRAHCKEAPIRREPQHGSAESYSLLRVDPSIKFAPITQSTLLPSHLQHPFRLYPPGTTFDLSEAVNSEPVTARHPTPEYFTMARSSPNVYYTNPLPNNTDPRDTRKLVVLDLNGAMLVRSERSNDPIANIQRKVYPRPFLSAFLDYILQPARSLDDWSNPSDANEQQMRPYEAFVWSSAQPLNVDTMIRLAFGKWGMSTSPNPQDRAFCEQMLAKFQRVESRPGRILGVWTRNEMDLTRAQYGMFIWR